MISLRQGFEPAARQPQRTRGVKTLTGPGGAAPGEEIRPASAHGEQIQTQHRRPGDIAPAQAAGVPIEGGVQAVVEAGDIRFGQAGRQAQVDEQADRFGVAGGQVAQRHLHGFFADGFGWLPCQVKVHAFALGIGGKDRQVQGFQAGGVVTRAAERLGVTRQHLHNRLKKFGIDAARHRG